MCTIIVCSECVKDCVVSVYTTVMCNECVKDCYKYVISVWKTYKYVMSVWKTDM